MSKPKTAEQWLAQKDLPTELGRVLVPGPWKHRWVHTDEPGIVRCRGCKIRPKEVEDALCPVALSWF